MRAFALFLLVGCKGSPVDREVRTETVSIPGIALRMSMVYLPAQADLPSYWIASREVTWGEFNRFYEFPEEEKVDGVTRPSAGKPYLSLSGLPPEFLDPELPVTSVRWHSAAAYAEWLSRRTGAVYRLPTAREWEAACGSPPGEGWHRDNSDDHPHPPGMKRPNLRGIYDMVGNVWEYALEPRHPPAFEPVLLGGAWNSPPQELDRARRRTAPAEWSEADPSRPFSTWWFRADFSQGFRLVRVPSTEGWRDYAPKIEISALSSQEVTLQVGSGVSLFARVRGEVRNGGDRALDELALKVYFLDPKGHPHLQDRTGGSTHPATYALSFPALVSSAHPGIHARPLSPGEKREFSADVPLSYDGPEDVNPAGLGASVLYVRFREEK